MTRKRPVLSKNVVKEEEKGIKKFFEGGLSLWGRDLIREIKGRFPNGKKKGIFCSPFQETCPRGECGGKKTRQKGGALAHREKAKRDEEQGKRESSNPPDKKRNAPRLKGERTDLFPHKGGEREDPKTREGDKESL